AAAMGFNVAKPGASGWQISGVLKEAFLESRQIPYGATLFYGYLLVEARVVSPSGAASTVTWRLHHYSGGYNAGLARKDEAEEAAAHLLVEGAQEFLARLN